MQRGLHQQTIEHALIAARNADGDRLGLVFDGIDRARELLDPLCQRSHEFVDQGALGPQPRRI